MTKKIIVSKTHEHSAQIEQIGLKREWMDNTAHRHAYQCMPMSLANTLGWGISFPEDISFIWDGISDTSDNHVKVLKGHRYCSTSRANATISFNTYLNFKTDENITTLVMPVPNQFNEYTQCFTALISTSFYKTMFPIAWKILKPNVEITIPANTPVAVILPISLTELHEFELHIKNYSHEYDEKVSLRKQEINKNLEYIKKQLQIGKFGHLYKKAQNYKGESVGRHEVKKIKLKTIND